MESYLRRLLTIGEEANRTQFPAQWKAAGKKVVGLLCSHVPEEIIHAAGMLPWRIMGTQRPSTPNADIYRPSHTCLYCNHVLESLLLGELDCLDAVVATTWDQDLVRLWDVWKYLGKTPFTFIIHLPRGNSEIHRKQFAKEVSKFSNFIADLAGQEITVEALNHSIAVYNRLRGLLHRVYNLRKSETPPLSGAEVLGITTAALLMPKEEVIGALETLLPFLENRTNALGSNQPRLLVSSDRLHNAGYLKAIEETGCLVAMDDLDTGSRYFWKLLDLDMDRAHSLEEMLHALALHYHAQPASPCMMDWEGQVVQIAEWVKDFNIQGVLELRLKYSRPREMRANFFQQKLTSMGIPVASFEREYHLANTGQLKTRGGAFVEMLQ